MEVAMLFLILAFETTITEFTFDEALKTILSRFQRCKLLLFLLVQFA